MKKIFFALAIFFMSFGLMAQSSYKVDVVHASINFKVKHLGITFVNGKFEKFDGGIVGNVANFEAARVFFNVDVASINTSVEARDNHLKSADFFEEERFPSMSFESTSIEKVDDENYKLNGMLQIKDVSKAVTFDVKFRGTTTGRESEQIAGFVASCTINRFDFNVDYDPSGTAIGKDVHIKLYLEFKETK